VTTMGEDLAAHVRHELPSLAPVHAEELARLLAALVGALRPERIYAFGSQARGTPGADSDVDLLVIVSASSEPGYRRAQAAYRAIGLHHLPLDILVLTRDEFEARRGVVASLPATVAREGRVLYAAA